MNARMRRAGERGGILTYLVIFLFLVVVCGLLYLTRHPLMRLAASMWIIDEPASHADVLIVLSGDNYYADRAAHAAQLFRQGVAPEVVASGGMLRPNVSETELMEHDLIERGVPKDRILRADHPSDSTLEEASALEKLAEQRGWKTVVLVTSNYHTRRARYIFRKVFPTKISVRVASAVDGGFNPDRWWEQRQSVKTFVRELAGMAVAMWELREPRRTQVPQGAGLSVKSTVDHQGTEVTQKACLTLYTA